MFARSPASRLALERLLVLPAWPTSTAGRRGAGGVSATETVTLPRAARNSNSLTWGCGGGGGGGGSRWALKLFLTQCLRQAMLFVCVSVFVFLRR